MKLTKPFLFVSIILLGCALSLLSSNLCSISFPKSAAVDILDKSLDSEIAVTFGFQLLSRHFNTFMLSSSLSKTLPRPVR